MNFHKSSQPAREGELVGVTASEAGWSFLDFRAVRLPSGARLDGTTADREVAFVLLGGVCSIASSEGSWEGIGGRADVFAGRPYALYLPPQTSYVITAHSDVEIGCCAARADQRHPARLIHPEDVEIEIRGGGNATRQISHIIKPDFPAQRLLVVEVYTPSGNWSSYPPHKHDRQNPPGEVILEETYYYRVSTPSGFALQRIYTAERDVDQAFVCHDGDLILIPRGYHPVCAAPGCQVYYLNTLAGDIHSMAASDDPELAWVRETWNDAEKKIDLIQ